MSENVSDVAARLFHLLGKEVERNEDQKKVEFEETHRQEINRLSPECIDVFLQVIQLSKFQATTNPPALVQLLQLLNSTRQGEDTTRQDVTSFATGNTDHTCNSQATLSTSPGSDDVDSMEVLPSDSSQNSVSSAFQCYESPLGSCSCTPADEEGFSGQAKPLVGPTNNQTQGIPSAEPISTDFVTCTEETQVPGPHDFRPSLVAGTENQHSSVAHQDSNQISTSASTSASLPSDEVTNDTECVDCSEGQHTTTQYCVALAKQTYQLQHQESCQTKVFRQRCEESEQEKKGESELAYKIAELEDQLVNQTEEQSLNAYLLNMVLESDAVSASLK